MAEWICLLRPVRPAMVAEGCSAAEVAAVADHFAHRPPARASGRIALAGRRQTTGSETLGIVLFGAGRRDEAEAFVAGEPAVARGVRITELYPFRRALTGSAAL